MPFTVSEFILALALVGVTLTLWRKNTALRRQFDDLETYAYKRFFELSDENDRLAKVVTNLKKQVREVSGTKFTADMTVGEAMEVHPRVRDVLASVNITAQGCGCHDSDELDTKTLAEAAGAKNTNLDQLLTTLNALGSGKLFVPPAAPATQGTIQIQMAPRTRG